jgi:putative oxidoreductase
LRPRLATAERLTREIKSESLQSMTETNSFFQRWEPIFLSIMRIVIGLLFMEHGTEKLFHFPPSGHGGGGPLPPLMQFAGWLEFAGGALLVLGLLTRLVAFIVAGEMAVAYFMAHAPHGTYPINNHGELAAAYCFVFLYMAVAGGGRWSIDALWRRKAVTTRAA